MYGINSLFAIKPGISREVDVYFPIFAASLKKIYDKKYYWVTPKVWSEVWSPLITYTSFITGTGFIKCIPITLSLLFVELAS